MDVFLGGSSSRLRTTMLEESDRKREEYTRGSCDKGGGSVSQVPLRWLGTAAATAAPSTKQKFFLVPFYISL